MPDRPEPAGPPRRSSVRGPSAALLAWLIGRGDGGGLGLAVDGAALPDTAPVAVAARWGQTPVTVLR